MVNLELYRVFYAVAKCGSLTKAAEELYISMSRLKAIIANILEKTGFSSIARVAIYAVQNGLIVV